MRAFGLVPTYQISIENEEFSSTQDLECADAISARKHAIGAALAFAAEQVPAGKPYFGALVKIEGAGEKSASSSPSGLPR